MDDQHENTGAAHAGNVIANRLRELGKSQAWLKDQVGVSHTAVSLWIRSGMISYKHAKKVAEVLKIPAHVMLGLTSAEELQNEETREAAMANTMRLQYVTAEEEELLTAWRETDESGRGIMRAVTRSVPRRKLDQQG